MSPLRVAVLIHTDDLEPARLMQDSYTAIVNELIPGSAVEFFNPPVQGTFPDISSSNAYDLIVVGGGTYIPDTSSPWLKKLIEFLQVLVGERVQQKAVAICLGHQMISTTFGGELGYLPAPELGVTEIQLTEGGREFFSRFLEPTSSLARESSALHIHEFHQRKVTRIPTGFTVLAADNQILLSNSENVLTFQGHPEMTGTLMKLLLTSSSSQESGYITLPSGEREEASFDKVVSAATKEHDGQKIWEAIFNWVRLKEQVGESK
ncbi:class I glutamine amidotransferase-like protein [Thozetella sp. PMI_491]|nr:class I glutamine amidotransferase-like protein [Thozetella sp. PMI_491]